MATPPKTVTPGGQSLVDDIPLPNDDVHWGRYWPTTATGADWAPVTEEAPSDGTEYVRKNTQWVASTAVGGTMVTEIVPTMAYAGIQAALPATIFGAGFTDPAQVQWNGVNIPTSFVSATELAITIDTTLGVAPSVAEITVVGATGAVGFHFLEKSAIDLDFGTGLTKDDTATPPIVHLQPAGDSPATLGGVYVIDRVRNQWEGLELGIDGRLRVPEATDALLGGILEPPPDDKGYVRRRDLAGVSAWVPPADTVGPDFGTGLSKDDTTTPPIVHLDPAGPTNLGGVFVPVRDALTQGLSIDMGDVALNDPATGELLAPPASDLLLGTLTEPPPDGLAYSRQWDNVTDPANPHWVWVPALTAGLQITSIIPDKAIFGPTEPLLTVHAYGSDFTGTCVIRVDGNDAQSAYVSPTEMTFVMNPAVPIAEQFHIITVHDPAAVPPALVDGLGAEQFDFIVASIAVDYGKGLSFDTSTTPPIVNLDPAGPTNLGGVIVSVRDATTQGLQIDFGDGTAANPATGELWAPPATPDLLGTITEPPADAKGYVRTTQLDGTSQWVPPALPPGAELEYRIGLIDRRPMGEEVIDLKIAGQNGEIGGVFPFGRGPTNGMDFDPATGAIWAPPATDKLLGVITEPPPDQKGYVRASQADGSWQWVPPATAAGMSYGIGLLDQRPVGIDNVDLKIANTNGEIGGVFVPGRSPLTGLELDPTNGSLTAPPATSDALGTIKEPPADQKGYVRASQADGSYQWVPPALPPESALTYGIGLDDQRPIGIENINLKIATTNGEIGGVFPFGRGPTNGLEFDPATGAIWAPPATSDLLGTITEPPADQKGYVRASQADGSFQWVPPAPTPMPDFRIGLIQPINPDGTFQPIVDLKIAGRNNEIGGVKTIGRGPTQGLELDPSTGLLTAPLATDVAAGSIVEPPPDNQVYGRKRGTGASVWEPVESGGIGDVEKEPIGETYVRSFGRWHPTDRNQGAQPRKVNVGGDIMTGLLILSGDPTDLLGAVPLRMLNQVKAYVDIQDTADRAWAETQFADEPPPGGPYWMLNGAWSNIPKPVTENLTYGIGLLDQRPIGIDNIDLKIAGTNGEIGGVQLYGRGPTNGLEFDPTTGFIWAPLATDVAAGSIVEPPPDDKQYVRTRTAAGVSSWTESTAGVDLTFGVGLLDQRPVGINNIDLKYAGENGEIGGIKVIGRSPINGLEFDLVTKILTAPPATDVVAGTIIEPPPDGSQYARMRDMAGVSTWQRVMAGGAIISDTPPDVAMTPAGTFWWESDSGDLFIMYDDGNSKQWVEAVAGAEAGNKTHIGDAPPTVTPLAGDLWWDSDAGTLAVYYTDADSSQWVQIAGPMPPPAAGGITDAPSDGTPYNRQDAAWVAAAAGGGLADAPNDGVQYTRGAPTAGGVNAWTAAAAATGAFLPLTGGTLTGNMFINSVNPTVFLDKSGATGGFAEIAGMRAGVRRWGVELAADTADQFNIRRYNDAGAPVDVPFSIDRATGAVNLNATTPTINASGLGLRINTATPFGQIDWANPLGIQSTMFIMDGRLVFAIPGGGGDIMRLIHATKIVDFAVQPTVNGTPVVMMAEHDAALARIGVLEALLTKLQARLDKCCPE